MIKRIFCSASEAYSRVGEQGIILASETPLLYQLNQLSCEIWELIDGNNTVGYIVDQIVLRYPSADPICVKNDIIELFQSLLDNGLIIDKEIL